MKKFWLAAAAALILTGMLPDESFAQRGGFRGGGFGGGGFRGAAMGGGFRGAAMGGGQAFVAQPSVQGSALARLGHASAPPRSRQAFGAEALALGIRS